MFECGRAHPVLGPILLVVLVVLLAVLFLHAAHEGIDVAAGVGEICAAVASSLWLLAITRLRLFRPQEPRAARRDRGPPAVPVPYFTLTPSALALLNAPLRR